MVIYLGPWNGSYKDWQTLICAYAAFFNKCIINNNVNQKAKELHVPPFWKFMCACVKATSTRNFWSPLEFWRNLLCFQYLWCSPPMPTFEHIHHIVSDLWPQNTSWKIGPFWVTKSTIAHHCIIIIQWKFSN